MFFVSKCQFLRLPGGSEVRVPLSGSGLLGLKMLLTPRRACWGFSVCPGKAQKFQGEVGLKQCLPSKFRYGVRFFITCGYRRKTRLVSRAAEDYLL